MPSLTSAFLHNPLVVTVLNASVRILIGAWKRRSTWDVYYVTKIIPPFSSDHASVIFGQKFSEFRFSEKHVVRAL